MCVEVVGVIQVDDLRGNIDVRVRRRVDESNRIPRIARQPDKVGVEVVCDADIAVEAAAVDHVVGAAVHEVRAAGHNDGVGRVIDDRLAVHEAVVGQVDPAHVGAVLARVKLVRIRVRIVERDIGVNEGRDKRARLGRAIGHYVVVVERRVDV